MTLGRVGADAGAAFSNAVALEDAGAEFASPDGSSVFLELFRAGKDVADAAEVVGMGFASVAAEKSVGAEKDGAVEIVERGGNDAVMKRREVEEDKDAPDEREEQTNSEAEAVEQGKSVKEAITFPEIKDRE